MKKTLIYFLLFCASALVGRTVAIHYLPDYIYSRFSKMALSRPGAAVNQFSVLMAPDENAKLVVKPNPDFAYATLFYDLTDGPIHILGAMPDSIYWSVALYQENTVNFYVKNDMQYDSDTLNIIISDDAMDQEADIEQIVSPEKTGFVLIRVLVAERDEAHQKAISDYLNALQIR